MDIEGQPQLAPLDPLNTGLLISSRFGFSKLAKLELEMGANKDIACGPEGLTPLMWASMAGHIDIIALLLQYNASLEIRTKSGNNSVMYAVANFHKDIIKILLHHGAESMDLDDNRRTLAATERLSWSVSFTSGCETCSALETVYEVMF